MLVKHEPLFEPLVLGKLRLKNRLVMSPTHVGMGGDKGMITDQGLCYYYARSTGGVSLVIVEATGVTGSYAFAPTSGYGAASDRHIPGLRDLARVIHWGGAKAFIQLAPGMGAQALKPSKDRPLVGPSDVPALIQNHELPKNLKGLAKKISDRPRPLSIEEIQAVKLSFVKAAVRAKEAGFDGIEVHGAHAFLLGQFTSPYYNRRDDEYGGSPEKRWRLSQEIIQATRGAVGKAFVIGYRLSSREWIPDGLELSEGCEMARAMEEAGVDYISVSTGCFGSVTHLYPQGEGTITSDAAQIKSKVTIPVICPNYQDPDKASEAISNGSIDLVALSRALLVDPFWVQKVKEEKFATIKRCIRCYQCVRAAIVDFLPVRCPVNKMLGFERFVPEFFPRPNDESAA